MHSRFTPLIASIHLQHFKAELFADDSHSTGLADAGWSAYEHCPSVWVRQVERIHPISYTWGQLFFIAADDHIIPIFQPLVQEAHRIMITYKLVEAVWLVNIGPEALTFVYSRFVVDNLFINVFELLRLG